MGWIYIYIFFISVLCLDAQTATEEVQLQSLPVKFYEMSENEWLNTEAKFRRTVSEDANNFCTKNASVCGMPRSWIATYNSSFKETDVKIQNAVGDRVYFTLKMYLVIPSSLSKSVLTKTKFILNKDATSTIVSTSRKTLAQEVGHPIVAVGEDQYSPTPNAKRNELLIPVSVVAMVVLCGVALYYKLKEARDRKKERKKLMQQAKGSRASSRENIAVIRPGSRDNISHMSKQSRHENEAAKVPLRQPRYEVDPETIKPRLEYPEYPQFRYDRPPRPNYNVSRNDYRENNAERQRFLENEDSFQAAPYAIPESTVMYTPDEEPKTAKNKKSGRETCV